MSSHTTEQLTILTTPEDKQRFEAEATRLNLTPAAYLHYLLVRQSAAVDPERLARHVQEVFGKHGELMRRLAK
jgi:hypothetical protein